MSSVHCGLHVGVAGPPTFGETALMKLWRAGAASAPEGGAIVKLDHDLKIRPADVGSFDGDENFGKKVEGKYGVWLKHHTEYCNKVRQLMMKVGDETDRKAQIKLLIEQYRELAYASERSKYEKDLDIFSPDEVLTAALTFALTLHPHTHPQPL